MRALRGLVPAVLVLLAGCARDINYVTYRGYEGAELPRARVAALATGTGSPGKYMIYLNAVDDRSPPASYTDLWLAYHVLPGPHRVRLMYTRQTTLRGDGVRTTKPVELDIVVQPGRSYIFEAREDPDRPVVRLRAVDVGDNVPDDCLNMIHPKPPADCYRFPWYRQ